MKLDFNKKYTSIAFYVVVVFAVCLLMVIAVFKFEVVAKIIQSIFKVLSPIIWAMVIAYLLNPVKKSIDKLLTKLLIRNKPSSKSSSIVQNKVLSKIPVKISKFTRVEKITKLIHILSIIITYILVIAAMVALLAIIIPQIANSILSIFNNANIYFINAEKWVNKILEDNPSISSFISTEFDTLKTYVLDFVNKLQPQLKTLISDVTVGVFTVAVGFKNFLLGLIVSIYLLISKDTFKAQIKKIMYACMQKEKCEKTIDVFRKVDTTFIKFISGKSLDSLIIAILCFISMSVMDMPYVTLISAIIGITNMIPFFGPIIGAIPSGILILLAQPNKVIAFVIFIIILQQFDGNFLGPKILGDSTGLPAFWVIFAIFIGGGMFGFTGMLVGVPVFAVIYTLSRQFIANKLAQKNLSTNTRDYK